MNHEKIKPLISSYLDGELDAGDKRTVEEHLASCPECRKEYEGLQKFEEVMSMVSLKSPSKELWDAYWASVYNRLERGIGWILLSLGAIVLLFFGAYKMVEGIINDPAMPLILKVGILAFLAGVAVLLVSIIREQFFLRKRERYKEIDQ
jgi:predicted anti-sigma-YlaC factor YlaD